VLAVSEEELPDRIARYKRESEVQSRRLLGYAEDNGLPLAISLASEAILNMSNAPDLGMAVQSIPTPLHRVNLLGTRSDRWPDADADDDEDHEFEDGAVDRWGHDTDESDASQDGNEDGP